MGVKISNLPAIVTPVLTDVFPVSQDGVTYKETITQLSALISLTPPTLPPIVTPAYTDVFAVVQGGVAYKETFTQLQSLFAISGVNNNITDLTAINTVLSLPGVSFSTTAEVIGTGTNDNADAGSVGEFISSVVAPAGAIALANAVSANVTSISLSAGDWDVWGNVGFTGNVLTAVVGCLGWTSTISATAPDSYLSCEMVYPVASTIFAANGVLGFTVPYARYSLAAPTTVYLSVHSTFGVNTCSGYGAIYARRAR